MDKHTIDVFLPHKKLRKLYYPVLALLGGMWLLDLNNLNVIQPTKVLQAWFLDKLLITTTLLLFLYSYFVYRLSKIYEEETKNRIEEKTKKLKNEIDKLKL